MAALIKTFTFGRVVIAITRDEHLCLQTTIHRSDKLAGDTEWTNGPFEDEDLPDLVVAIGAAYKYVRHDDMVQLPRTSSTWQHARPTKRAVPRPAPNERRRSANIYEALSLRRIP